MLGFESSPRRPRDDEAVGSVDLLSLLNILIPLDVLDMGSLPDFVVYNFETQ